MNSRTIQTPCRGGARGDHERLGDGIAHYAYGFGDDNPPVVRSASRRPVTVGAVIARPGFWRERASRRRWRFRLTTAPGGGAPSRVSACSGPATTSGSSGLWARPTGSGYGGSRLASRRRRHGSGGHSELSVRRRAYRNDAGELIAIWHADFVHTERDTAAKRDTLREARTERIYSERGSRHD